MATAVKEKAAPKRASRSKAKAEAPVVPVPEVVFEEPTETPTPEAEAFSPFLPVELDFTPVDMDSLTWYRDPTKESGEWTLTVMPVGQVLMATGVFTGTAFDASLVETTEAQRTILKITPTSKKAKLLRHVFRGGSVPTVIMTTRGKISPLDGLQRLHVHALVAQALLNRKKNPRAVFDLATQDALNKLDEMGYVTTDFDSFIAAPMPVQIWRNLTVDEEDRMFGVLNLDGTNPSTRHMAEMLHGKIRDRITALGIKTVSEKEAAGAGAPKVRAKDASPKEVVRPLADVNVVFLAYLTGFRTSTKKLMLEEGVNDRMLKGWANLGDKIVKADMQWLYHEVLPALHARYDESDSTVGKQIRTESETWLVPMMAALGVARQDGASPEQIVEWKDAVMELLAGDDPDPLKLDKGKGAWSSAISTPGLPGSVGQSARRLTFHGWLNSIRKGLPLDWTKAARDAVNSL